MAEHLSYSEALLYFIYSFSWDVAAVSWDELARELKGDRQGAKGKGWKLRRLHERPLEPNSGETRPTYQPSLVTRSDVLERSGIIGDILIYVPTTPQSRRRGASQRARLSYTVRLFDNGGATCTFELKLTQDTLTLRDIHAALHLVKSMDIGGPGAKLERYVTEASFELAAKGSARSDTTLIPAANSSLRLLDLFRTLLWHPPAWAPHNSHDLWADRGILAWDDPQQDFQSPLVFSCMQVSEESFLLFQTVDQTALTQEIGSILCRLALDNRDLDTGYRHINLEYLASTLPYCRTNNALINLCMDQRLFFTLGTRGAIALSPDLTQLPSCFVVPSLLNLCEILRARWHTSVLINTWIDLTIRRLTGPSELSLQIDSSALVKDVFKWRSMFLSFLRDHVPYLFDGGSVLEAARHAETALRLQALRQETSQKFAALDRLVEDVLERRRLDELKRLYGTESYAT